MAATLTWRLSEHLMRADDLDAAIASLKPMVRHIASQLVERHTAVAAEIVPLADFRPEEPRHERMRA